MYGLYRNLLSPAINLLDRRVAQSGSVLRSGRRGRGFKSRLSDKFIGIRDEEAEGSNPITPTILKTHAFKVFFNYWQAFQFC